jgi:glycosyltransferase involved in cell wall biosynthesis
LRVLVVTSYFWPEDFRINDLAADLAAKGHTITVFTGIPNYPGGKFFDGYGLFSKRMELHGGVRILRYPLIPRGKSKPWNLVLNYVSSAIFSSVLAPLVCREPFDVIFVCQLSPVTVGCPAVVLKKLRSIPVVLWILDLWPESLLATGAVRSPAILGVVRKLVRWIYGNCDRILVSSRGFSGGVASTGGYTGPIVHLPNWVEPEYTSGLDAHGAGMPELAPGFKIMFAGNIGEAQDFPTLLGAAERLKSFQDIHWIILGDGRKAEWVAAEVRRRGLQNQFHLMGRYPAASMPGFYAQADALLLSLRREPLFELTAPGKLTSYLASGRPVIAALDGEGARIVDEARAGVSCPAGSPKLLAERVLQLYRMSADERARMGERGRLFCKQKFDRKVILDRLEQVLFEVVRDAKPSSVRV